MAIIYHLMNLWHLEHNSDKANIIDIQIDNIRQKDR